MTGTDFCANKQHMSRSYLNHLVVPFGSYTATEALFQLFVAVLEGFCCYTFQLVGYAFLDIIKSTKLAPFQVVFESGE